MHVHTRTSSVQKFTYTYIHPLSLCSKMKKNKQIMCDIRDNWVVDLMPFMNMAELMKHGKRGGGGGGGGVEQRTIDAGLPTMCSQLGGQHVRQQLPYCSQAVQVQATYNMYSYMHDAKSTLAILIILRSIVITYLYPVSMNCPFGALAVSLAK